MQAQVKELLLQSLVHERGGVQVYETALRCVRNADLKQEWEKYLSQTQNHVEVLTQVCQQLGIDPQEQTPGCHIVHDTGAALVRAMEQALQTGEPAAAEIVAAECVVLAETKDHLDWELMGAVAKKAKGEEAKILTAAYEEVEDQEDEHLYHTRGWCRELWLKSLGMKAELPPPEEKHHVKTAIGAARAQQSRNLTP